MATSRATAVQTPGDTPTTAPADQPATAAPSSTVEELQAQLAAQQQQMAAMMTMMQNLQANQRVTPAQAQAEALPDMGDLDLDEINRGSTPVLTRQGWIVPPNYGADPVSLAEKAAQEKRDAALMKLAEAASNKA